MQTATVTLNWRQGHTLMKALLEARDQNLHLAKLLARQNCLPGDSNPEQDAELINDLILTLANQGVSALERTGIQYEIERMTMDKGGND